MGAMPGRLALTWPGIEEALQGLKKPIKGNQTEHVITGTIPGPPNRHEPEWAANYIL